MPHCYFCLELLEENSHVRNYLSDSSFFAVYCDTIHHRFSSRFIEVIKHFSLPSFVFDDYISKTFESIKSFYELKTLSSNTLCWFLTQGSK